MMISRRDAIRGSERDVCFPRLAIWLALVLLGLPTLGWTQAEIDPRTKTSVTVPEHGWAETGDLVLAVKIQAGGKTAALGKMPAPGSGEAAKVFTMGGSWLIDRFSQQKILPLPRLPMKPFFGTMSGIITLEPGDSLTFGVAFPRPPDPPAAENGNPQDYKLILHIPEMEDVEITIPRPKK